MRLNDDTTDPAKQVGYAATSSTVVNTKDSFTVSAWVQLSNASANRVVLAEPGTNGSAFALYYSSSSKQWIFNRTDKDQADHAFARSVADQTNPPLNVWTHLAGVFDAKRDADKSNDTIQLFVNGRPQGAPVVLSNSTPGYEPWTANEGLQMGRSKLSGKYGENFFGLLDEVAVWQRPLTGDEIAQEAQAQVDGVPTNELVAQWDAAGATATDIPESTAYPLSSMKLAGGATLSDDSSAVVLDGTTGYGHMTGPVVDESGSFTVSASVEVDGEKLAAKPVGYTGQVAGQRTANESSWALWITKPADGTYVWKFTRTALGADGKVTQTAEAPGQDVAETDTWVQVTGVFDAQESWDSADPADPSNTLTQYGALHLYIGEFRQPSGGKSGFTAAQPGNGELAMGRGASHGTTGNYLPGSLQDLRIWTGAMTVGQVGSQAVATPETG